MRRKIKRQTAKEKKARAFLKERGFKDSMIYGSFQDVPNPEPDLFVVVTESGVSLEAPLDPMTILEYGFTVNELFDLADELAKMFNTKVLMY